MSDVGETNYLLGELLKEIKALRLELMVVTGDTSMHDLDDIHSAIRDAASDLGSKIDDMADRITGSIGGIGGSSLDEICSAVDSVSSTIELNSK